MKVASHSLIKKAKQIPSALGEKNDSMVLRELYDVNKSLYFDFCLSRYNQLLSKSSKKEDILSNVTGIFEIEKNENFYLPFLDLILNYQTPDKVADLVYKNLFTEKCYNVYYFVASHQKLNLFIGKLVFSLFKMVPSKNESYIIGLRDNMLLRYIDFCNDNYFIFKCVKMIPPSFSTELFFEFLFLSSYLINAGFSDERFGYLLMNTALSVSEPNQIIQLILDGKFKIPKLFVDWIEYKFNNKYCFNKSIICEKGLNELPVLLRMQMLQKLPSSISGPRLCRTLGFDNSCREEALKRVLTEKDPKQMHDYLIALGKPLPINKNLPLYYTLLSMASLKNPELSELYVSDFCKLRIDSDEDLLLSASIGLEKLASIYNDIIPSVFPQIRLFLRKCSKKAVRIHLLNAIAYAVGSEMIDEEFVWRDYHSIRTVSDNGLDFDNLTNYCIIGLNDPDEVEVAEPMLEKLLRKDKLSIISGLFRVPVDKISPFNKLYSLLPDKEPVVNLKKDKLLDITKYELTKELTTQRILQLATGFTMFFDVFKDFKEKWIEILVNSGEYVFNMNVTNLYIDELMKVLQESKDEKERFACGYSFALFLAYRLIEPLSISNYLKEHVLKEESNIVILICLYALSYCPSIDNALSFIERMISKGRSKSLSNDVLFGVGYCINSWFSSLLTLFQNNIKNDYIYLPGIWPFYSYILDFLGKHPIINSSDKVSCAQIIYLFTSNAKYDTLVDDFIIDGIEPDIALTALCGYVPDISFRISSFAPNERQRKLISSVSKEIYDFDFIEQLLTRQRLYHKQKPHSINIGNQKTSIETLKADFNKLSEDSINIIIAQLSDNQIQKIVSDVNEDYSLFTAIHLKNINYIANILSVTKPKEIFLKKLKKNVPDVQKLIEKMFKKRSPINRISEIVTYYQFDEVLSDDNNIAIIPILLSKYYPKIKIIKIIKEDYHSILNDLLQCLLLKYPSFFQKNEESFDYFE